MATAAVAMTSTTQKGAKTSKSRRSECFVPRHLLTNLAATVSKKTDEFIQWEQSVKNERKSEYENRRRYKTHHRQRPAADSPRRRVKFVMTEKP